MNAAPRAVRTLCAVGIILGIAGPSIATDRPAAQDIPGEVLVLDSADSVATWNTKAFIGPEGPTVEVVSEEMLIREGSAAVRWKCAGAKREKFGFTVPQGKQDWSNYDQVQLWMHSRNHTWAGIRPALHDGKNYWMAPGRINWRGWRLVTIPKEKFRDTVDFSNVQAFGLEEHTYRGGTFRPETDTVLTIDSVVLSRKILEGELTNKVGTQKGPFVYVARIHNVSDRPRTVRLSLLQQREADTTDEVQVTIEPAELSIAPNQEAFAKLTITVTPEQLASPQKLRGLVVSAFATLDGHVVPQLEFRVPVRRTFFDSLELQHPRVYLDEEGFTKLKKRIETDPRSGEMWKDVLRSADKALTDKIGNARDKRQRLFPMVTLAMAYRVTGEQKYFDRAREYLEHALAMEALNTTGKGKGPFSTNLAAGHHVMNLGIAYDWLYGQWTEDERDALRELIVEKGLKVHYIDCMSRYAWGHEYGSNWSAVVSGGNGVGALAVLGDAPDASRFVDFTTERLERIAEDQGIDGEGLEGTSYWNYNMNYCTYLADALRTTTSGAYNLYRLQPFYHKTCYYYVGAMMPEGDWVTFADAWHNNHLTGPNAVPPLNPHFLRMASEFKDGYLQWKARTSRGGLFGLLWYDPSVEQDPTENRPLAQLFRRVGYTVLRSTNEGVDGVALAMRAGDNGDGHGHYDVMNFIVSGYGYQLAADYLPSKYGAPGYFGFTRPLNKRAATFGHNCILVNGQGQVWDVGAEARFKEFFHSSVADYIQADGGKMYGAELLNKWNRHVLFVRPNYFVMWDELASPKPVRYEWRMLTWSQQREPPVTTEHGALVTTCAYKKLPDKVAQMEVAHVASPVGHTTLVDRFVFDPKVDRNSSMKRSNFFIKTLANEKTDRWTLMTMLFPFDKSDRGGRGEFEPIRKKDVIGAKIRDVKDPVSPDTVLINLTDGEVKASGIRFVGRAALVSGKEATTRCVLIEGTQLARGETVLVKADNPVTIAISLQDDEWVGSIQAREDTNVTIHVGEGRKLRLQIEGKEVVVESENGLAEVNVPKSTMDDFLKLQGVDIGRQY